MWKTRRLFCLEDGIIPVKVMKALTRLQEERRSLMPVVSESSGSSFKSPITIGRWTSM